MDRSIGCGIATGDLHVTAFADFSRNIGPDGLTPLGKSLIQTVGWLASLAGQRGLDWLLNGGDYTTTPGVLDVSTLFLLSKLEETWLSIPNRILNLGNHDIDSKVGLHNLALHSKIPGWSIPQYKETLHKFGLYVVPFTYSIEDQVSLLRAIPDDSVVAVHTPISGARLNPHTVDENGVPLSEFSRFAFTLAAHYHTPQLLSSAGRRLGSLRSGLGVELEKGDVLILGTPLPHSFADTGDVYGAWVVDAASRVAEFVSNPFAPLYINATVVSDDDVSAVQAQVGAAAGRAVYLSLAAPKALHQDLLKVDFQATGVRLRRQIEEAPTRERMSTPLREGGVPQMLFAYLDSVGDPYPRELIESDLIREIGLLPPGIRSIGGRVNFIQVAARNFLSYEELDFDLQIEGLWLVTGINKDTDFGVSNGSGKSALFESIVWGLYGELLRGCPAKNSVIRAGEKSCSVTLTFEANGSRYQVQRDRSMSKATVALRVLSGGVWADISPGSVADTNRSIVDTVGLSLDDLTLTTLFASYTNCNFASNKDSDKKIFLRRVYDLEIFDLLSEIYRLKCRGTSNDLAAVKALVEREERMLSSLAEDYESKKEAVVIETENRRQQLAALLTSISGLSSVEEILKGETRSLRECLDTLRGLLRSSQEKEIKLELICIRIGATEKCRTATPQAAADECRYCGQEIKGDRAHYETSCQREAQQLQEELSRLRAEEEKLRSSLQLPSSVLLEKIEPVSIEARRKELHLAEAATALAVARERLRALQALPDPKGALEELEQRIAATEAHVLELKDREGALGAKGVLYERLLSALGPQGVVSYVLDSAVYQLNTYLDSISESLYGGDYSVRLSSTKELVDGRTSNVISLQYSTPGNSFALSSGGEKRKAEIALFIALNYLLADQGRGSTNLVILDEALYSLDYRAATSAVEAIRKFVHEEHKVGFLVCHSEEVKSLCDQQIIVERQNEISRIVTHGTL